MIQLIIMKKINKCKADCRTAASCNNLVYDARMIRLFMQNTQTNYGDSAFCIYITSTEKLFF